MTYNAFSLHIKNHIAHLSFNKPDKANSLDTPDWEEMQSIFQHIDENPEARVVVLSGKGKHFCAGIDLAALMGLQNQLSGNCEARKRDQVRQYIFKLQNAITAIEACRKPVLAAIHGGCIGGGVDLASACDIRYCTQDAYFTIKEISLGLVADIGTLQRLPYIIHPGIMAEMAYTGRKVFGPEAEKIGLVNSAYPTQEALMENVQEIAAQIAAKSPLCIRGTKEILLYQRDHSVSDGLKNMANYNAAMLLSKDLTESFQAHFEKRQPQFEENS